jgi:hypothetical protein
MWVGLLSDKPDMLQELRIALQQEEANSTQKRTTYPHTHQPVQATAQPQSTLMSNPLLSAMPCASRSSAAATVERNSWTQ